MYSWGRFYSNKASQIVASIKISQNVWYCTCDSADKNIIIPDTNKSDKSGEISSTLVTLNKRKKKKQKEP